MKMQISTSNMDQNRVFKDSSKSHDADMQSSDRRSTAVKSDISIELGSGCFEMDAKKPRDHINGSEDGLNTMADDSQQRTESSCSNSLSVVLPVCGGPADSSNSKTTSAESGVCAQIARKAITNARAKNSMNISLTGQNHSLSPAKKGDEEISHEDGEVIAGFDLNEDINANELDDCIQPVNETASSPCVIHVVAKTGIPSGQPMIPLKFEGGLGWKGSAETSAFRPANSKTSSSNERRKEPQGFTGIDLNVAAVEDCTGLQDSHSEAVSSKRVKTLSIDLNCLYDDGDDEFNQPSHPPKSRNPTLVDLNKISDSANPGKRDFDFASHDYLAHLSMQHIANNAYNVVATPNILQPVELMQKVASLQPNFPFMPQTLPPQNYPSTGPFQLPYARYSHEYGTVNALFGTPYLVQKRDAKTEDNLSTSGSKMDEARQFSFLAKNAPFGEHMHQGAWYAASMKRKEPEGGLESYQLGYKQVT